jgi:DNA topoisomerase-3
VSERDWLNANPKDAAKRPRVGDGPAGAAGAATTCNCAEKPAAAQRTTSKPGANQGRVFYACAKRREEQCGFFQWCDESPSDLPQRSSSSFAAPAAQPQRASGAACFKCNQTGHFARDCPGDAATGGGGRLLGLAASGMQYPRPSTAGAAYGANRPPPSGGGEAAQCSCGTAAVLKTVQKEGANHGRTFYSCSKREQSEKCTFFHWADSAAADGPLASNQASSSHYPSSSSYSAGRGGGKNCFKCNQPGHFARDCENQGGAAGGAAGSRSSNFR